MRRARSARRAFLPLALLVVAAGVAGVVLVGKRHAHGAAPDPRPFIGTWTTTATPHIKTVCRVPDAGDNATSSSENPLDPAAVGVHPGSDLPGSGADLVLEISCRCRLPLAISSADANLATLLVPTPCQLVEHNTQIMVTVQTLTLRVSAMDARAANLDLVTAPSGDCISSEIVANLVMFSTKPADCGPDDTAVGIMPASFNGVTFCPVGGGRDAILLNMENEETTVCPEGTGSHGEGGWVLPQAGNEVVVCHPRRKPPDDPLYSYTFLPFCRVDGTQFKPLTTDPMAVEQFYAVLKLGSAPCPNGATEMVRRVDNEDIGNRNGFAGFFGPNDVQDGTTQINTTATTLHFCYFRWASATAETMAAFPDLGFPYAVFHDFDGPQPSWVTVKRWIYGLDETRTSTMQVPNLSSVPPDEEAVKQFQAIVDNPDNATVFDLARVR